jgi:broad specificity phosphatase PhoE
MADPELTPLGEVQCARLCSLLSEKQKHEKIGLIVSSPLRRAIQTALVAFKPLIDRGYKVLALPGIQEVSDLPCDTGSDLALIQAEFEKMPVDWSMVEPGWNAKVRDAALPSLL